MVSSKKNGSICTAQQKAIVREQIAFLAPIAQDSFRNGGNKKLGESL